MHTKILVFVFGMLYAFLAISQNIIKAFTNNKEDIMLEVNLLSTDSCLAK